ncbi:MAG TPA: hypothetical protein VF988_11355 [Verrucomicrobiae bacterium]
MPNSTYERLTREHTPRQFAVAVASRSSLWLGEDHLLLVDCSGATETYKRFYFRDIQAITIRKTNGRAIWNRIFAGILCFFAVVFFMIMLAANWNTVSITVAAIFLTGFALPLLGNNLLGSMCACQIRTAVQIEDVPSLTRLARARKVLDRVRPLIVAAQGQLAEEEVTLRLQQILRAGNPTAPATPEPATPGAVPPVMS